MKSLKIKILLILIFFASCKSIKSNFTKTSGIIVYEVVDNCKINIFFIKNNIYYKVDDSKFSRKKRDGFNVEISKEKDLDYTEQINIRRGVDPFSFIGNNNIYTDNKNSYYIIFKFEGYVSKINLEVFSDNMKPQFLRNHHFKGTLEIDKIVSTQNFINNHKFTLSETGKKYINLYPCGEADEIW